jgi:uroporphyrinogen-III synthase
MSFSHILITRPRQEAVELAKLLAPCAAEIIIMPAYGYYASPLFPDQISQMQQAAAGFPPPLLIFTSPRAVEYGLGQVPTDVLHRSQLAAIGPTTANLLEQAGLSVSLQPRQGYSSEDLLKALAAQGSTSERPARGAYIFTAPGGRTALKEGLQAQGYEPHVLMVYGSKSAALATGAIAAIEKAEALLAVWTSANAMNALSQRLPTQSWSHLCRAEWLVISERLRRVARAFSPRHIHLAAGPTNSAIVTAIQAL